MRRIDAGKPRATASALSQLEDLGLIALFGWDQRSLLLAMPQLTTAPPIQCGLA